MKSNVCGNGVQGHQLGLNVDWSCWTNRASGFATDSMKIVRRELNPVPLRAA